MIDLTTLVEQTPPLKVRIGNSIRLHNKYLLRGLQHFNDYLRTLIKVVEGTEDVSSYRRRYWEDFIINV